MRVAPSTSSQNKMQESFKLQHSPCMLCARAHVHFGALLLLIILLPLRLAYDYNVSITAKQSDNHVDENLCELRTVSGDTAHIAVRNRDSSGFWITAHATSPVSKYTIFDKVRVLILRFSKSPGTQRCRLIFCVSTNYFTGTIFPLG